MFEGHVEASNSSTLHWLLADSLFRSGRGGDAYAIACTYLTAHGYDRRLAQLKARVEWEIRDVEGTLRTWHLIDSEEGGSIVARLNRADILYAEDRRKEARQAAESCLSLEPDATPTQRMRLANVLAALGHGEAERIGYQALRDNRNSAEMLKGFFSLSQRLEEPFAPSCVSDGTSVKLRDNRSDERWFHS